jgi:hypothetical protein
MSTQVWLGAATLTYPQAGGHFWAYLNWALGLRALGCDVTWLEACDPMIPAGDTQNLVTALKQRLEPYGLGQSVALCSLGKQPLPATMTESCIPIERAEEADLLLNLSYSLCEGVMDRFHRSAMIDIDPGLLQVWINEGTATIPRHDIYFTIGETVGQATARFPSAGMTWHYTPPCVALDWWPVSRASNDAPFTTVSHWSSRDWIDENGEPRRNDKRSGFLPFMDLPRRTSQPLELALCLEADEELILLPHEEEERQALAAQGWHVRHAHAVASTPWDYQTYIQNSRGEFSCVKPSCLYLQNAWISDRTLCYLASGKPAIIQHTGPSSFLPDAAGLFRFRDLEEAVRCLDRAASDYANQCSLARALAEEHFDARKVVGSLLERALA